VPGGGIENAVGNGTPGVLQHNLSPPIIEPGLPYAGNDDPVGVCPEECGKETKYPRVLRDDGASPRKKGGGDAGEEKRFRIHGGPAPSDEPPPGQIHGLLAVVQEFDIFPFSREGSEHDLVDHHTSRRGCDIDLKAEPVIRLIHLCAIPQDDHEEVHPSRKTHRTESDPDRVPGGQRL
jgi:hypothetical protein